MKKITRIEKILPIVLAVLLPMMNYINGTSLFEQFTLWQLLPAWAVSSGFMLAIWYLNDWAVRRIQQRRLLSVALINLCMVLIFAAVIPRFLPAGLDITEGFHFTLGLRILSGLAILITVQQSVRSAATVEMLKSENLALKTEKYKAELDQLRKQVNPHFLFNSLSTLRSMIRHAHPNSEKFVMNLSSMYRQILHSRDRDSVPLKEELKFSEAYCSLMKHRQEEALTFSIETRDESRHLAVPVFALQLLLENCFKHNIASVEKPLKIRIFQKDKETITVSNNYQPKERVNHSTGVGLSNLEKRYRMMGIDEGLTIDRTDADYEVTLKLFKP